MEQFGNSDSKKKKNRRDEDVNDDDDGELFLPMPSPQAPAAVSAAKEKNYVERDILPLNKGSQANEGQIKGRSEHKDMNEHGNEIRADLDPRRRDRR